MRRNCAWGSFANQPVMQQRANRVSRSGAGPTPSPPTSSNQPQPSRPPTTAEIIPAPSRPQTAAAPHPSPPNAPAPPAREIPTNKERKNPSHCNESGSATPAHGKTRAGKSSAATGPQSIPRTVPPASHKAKHSESPRASIPRQPAPHQIHKDQAIHPPHQLPKVSPATHSHSAPWPETTGTAHRPRQSIAADPTQVIARLPQIPQAETPREPPPA